MPVLKRLCLDGKKSCFIAIVKCYTLHEPKRSGASPLHCLGWTDRSRSPHVKEPRLNCSCNTVGIKHKHISSTYITTPIAWCGLCGMEKEIVAFLCEPSSFNMMHAAEQMHETKQLMSAYVSMYLT